MPAFVPHRQESALPAVALSRSALAVPVLLAALAACAGTDVEATSSGPATPSAASSPAADSSPSEDAVADLSADDADGSWDKQTLIPAMQAAIKGQRSAHVSVTGGVTGREMPGQAVVAFKGARQDISMTVDGAAMGVGKVEVRMVDRVVYVSLPPLTPRDKFVEVRPGDTSSPFAAMAGQMQAVDPRDTFAVLTAGLRKMEFVAEESVHGENLEHYRLTIDTRAAGKVLGIPRTPGEPRTIAYEVWLDEQALMRRVEVEMPQLSMVTETDWGKPVSIKAPPRRSIVQASGQ